MVPTVAIFGTNGGTSFSTYGFDQGLQRIGMNTGNAIFQFALWKLVANPKYTVEPGATAQSVRANANQILIPAANQVNAAWDMTWLADMLEACDLPVACIGLGAQAGVDSSPKIDLKPGTIRYLHILSERTSRIGVRGVFTQEVLANYGVTNTVVTGCPSQTINPHIEGADIQSQLDRVKAMEQPSIGYVLGTLEEEARKAESLLAQQVKSFDHSLILQTDPRLLRIIFDRAVAEGNTNYVNWIRGVFRPDLSYDQFVAYFLKHATFYSDARTWIDSMRRYDLVIGMRIHGAVAAIQAGKLGVCVAFDSRTKELAQTMGYPYLPVDKIEPDATLNAMLNSVIFDADTFDQSRKRNAETVCSILTENGMTLSAT
jgi:hypothetical protein